LGHKGENKMKERPGEFFYREGMQYDWRQDKSPSAATLARAAFKQAAQMGHIKATHELAHLYYYGTGGIQDQERALLLLWSCFQRGDDGALEQLVDMLNTYAEQVPAPQNAKAAALSAQKLEQIAPMQRYVESLMQEFASQIEQRAQQGAQRDGP
jgi:TPR repeat protein